jgi:predicted Zn-dependent peptidase
MIGARQTAKVDSDGIVFGSAASSGNLVHVLDDIGRWLQRKDLYPFVFEPHRKRTAEQLATQGTAFDREADWFAARLYGADHAYGVRGDGEACRRVGEGDVAGWLRRALQPANATLVLVGDLPPRQELDRHLADWIGGWRAAESAKPMVHQQSPLPTAAQWKLEPLKGATQSAIRIGVRFDRLDAADLASSDVLVALLQDRLTRELRVKDGATYHVEVRRLLRPNASGLEISTSVGVAASSRAVQSILAELAALRTEAGTAVGRIAMTRWQLARTFSARFDTASGIAAHMERALWLGWEPSVWDSYPAQLAKVDAAVIRRLAMRLDLETPVVSIVGDPGVVRPQLEQAGLAVP